MELLIIVQMFIARNMMIQQECVQMAMSKLLVKHVALFCLQTLESCDAMFVAIESVQNDSRRASQRAVVTFQ